MAQDLGNLANIYAENGEINKSIETEKRIIKIFKGIGAWPNFVFVSKNLIIDLLNAGDYSGAAETAREGIEVAEKLPHMARELQDLKQMLEFAEQKMAESGEG